MASLLNQRWLQSTVEHELKELVEWRQRMFGQNPGVFVISNKPIKNELVRDLAARNVSDLYRDDGSSLYAHRTADRNEPCAMQILEVCTESIAWFVVTLLTVFIDISSRPQQVSIVRWTRLGDS